MDRMQLTFVIAAVLFLAFVLGWLFHWLFTRVNYDSAAPSNRRKTALFTRLQEAQEARLFAEERAQQIEQDAMIVVDQLRAELASTNEALAAALTRSGQNFIPENA